MNIPVTSGPRRELLRCLALFIVAGCLVLVLRAALAPEYRQNQSTDYTGQYEPVARAILEGRGISDGSGALATRYPPGFSLLLAGTWALGRATGLSDEAALLGFELLCAGSSVVLLYGLARLVWNTGPAIGVGLAWATYPFFLWINKQPNSEVPFIPVFFGALLVFWLAVLRRPRATWLYLAAGALCGAAMLIRAAAIGLGFVLVLLLLAASELPLRARIGGAALLLIGNLLVVLPWMAAARTAHGRVIPLSTGGELAILDGLTFLVDAKDYRVQPPVAGDVQEMMLTFQRRGPEMSSAGAAAGVVLEEAGRAPLTFVRLMLIKAGRSWYGTDSLSLEAPARVLQVLYLFLCLWGVVYAWRDGGALRRLIAGLCLIVLYFWAMTMAVLPLLRYMLPAIGLLFVALPGAWFSLRGRVAPHPALALGRPS